MLRLGFVCVLFSKLMPATAIVAAIFPNAIYIAADSRLTRTASSAGGMSGAEGCKIVQTPMAAFAVAALTSDSKTGFDFRAIASQALVSSSGSLSMRIDAVEQALTPKLKLAADAVKADFPDVYETFRAGHLGQAVFAGWDAGHPVLIEDDWNIADDGHIKQERFPATDEMNLIILGSGGDAILRYVRDNPDWWMSSAPEALEQLIRAAIRDAETTHSADVGGSVSVLMIDAHGQRWVTPGVCRDAVSR